MILYQKKVSEFGKGKEEKKFLSRFLARGKVHDIFESSADDFAADTLEGSYGKEGAGGGGFVFCGEGRRGALRGPWSSVMERCYLLLSCWKGMGLIRTGKKREHDERRGAYSHRFIWARAEV